jgi:hypothetical protein
MHDYIILTQTTLISQLSQKCDECSRHILPKDYNTFPWICEGQLYRVDSETENKNQSFQAFYK